MHMNARARNCRKREGFALVLVITSLVLMTILGVSFLLGTTTELAGARMYAQSLGAKRYSELAVNLVLAQMNSAMSEGSASAPVAWASQPGMIRTWDEDGNPSKVYRLYSSIDMVADALSFDPVSESNSLASWKSGANSRAFNALWCDLNSPINSSSGRIYPIMPPTQNGDPLAGVPTGEIEGFNITSPPGFEGGIPPSETNNPAPMPVQWLYVLRDGSIEPASSGGTTSQISINGASSSNPIVARIAFWTDDESAKVNVNTASEGHFWDTPVTDGKRERDLAINNPVRGEFQRTPGHPFTVSLSQSLGKFKGRLDSDFQSIYALTPRTSWGGSENGTKPFPIPIWNTSSPGNPTAGLPGDWATRAATMKRMPFKVERLYASIEEMLFKPERYSSPGSPSLNAGLFASSPSEIRRLKFFNTTAARSPETTLFNTPRVSIWPLTWPSKALLDNGNTDNIPLAPEERLLAFAARLNGNPYFYQRYDSKSTTNDYEEVERNAEVMKYLVNLGSRKIPGFGGSFSDKWGDDLLQNHANVFDYIRSGVNLNNRSAVNSSGVPTPYYYAGKNYRASDGLEDGGGTVMPIQYEVNSVSVQGMGNFPTITEAALVVYGAERRNPNPASNDPNTTYFINYGTLPPAFPRGAQTTKVGAYLAFEFANSLSGYIGRRTELALVVKGASFTINGQSLGFPSNNGMTVYAPLIVNGGSYLHSEIQSFMGTSWLMGAGRDNGAGSQKDRAKLLSTNRSSYDRIRFPLYGDVVSVNPSDTSFLFSGSSLEVEIWTVDSTVSARPLKDKVQTLNIDMSKLDGFYPMPVIPAFASVSSATANVGPGAWRQYSVSGSPTRDYINNGTQYDLAALPAGALTAASLRQEFYNTGSYYYDASAPAYAATVRDMRSLQVRMDATVVGGVSIVPGNDSTPSGYDQPIVARGYGNDQFADTMMSMQLDPGGTPGGDIRLLLGRANIPSDWFVIHPAAADIKKSINNEATISRTTKKLGAGVRFLGNPDANSGLAKNESLLNIPMGEVGFANVKPVVSGRTVASPVIGDWNNAFGSQPDGAVIPKPQDTFLTLTRDPSDGSLKVPFFNEYNGLLTGTGDYFSPSRQLAGPVAFGVLPSGLKRARPWEQFLFNPNPMIGAAHPGFNNPPDHLFLDLFWMPVVEPYAISEPLSTAGKINLNQQIVPFGHVERYTGLHALLRHMRITAIPRSGASNYKNADRNYGGQFSNQTDNEGNFRRDVDVAKTVAEFKARLDIKPFISASELTEIWMIPSGITDLAATKAFWSGAAAASPNLTGANSRQQPYNHLYSLVTTKSNSFTIHWRVQVLEKSNATNPGGWVESADKVRSEYRGSTLVERYIDPNDRSIPDYATDSAPRPLHEFYKWRVVSNTQFNP